MAYGTLKADVIQSDTAGTPPQFRDGNSTQIGTLCRAWVNFNGTGTVAIRASGKVSSITDNGTGDYTVNLTTALVDANYSVTSMAGGTSSIGWSRLADTPAPTTSGYRLYVANSNGSALADAAFVNVHFFR